MWKLFVCIILGMMCMGVVCAAPLIRGSEKMRLNATEKKVVVNEEVVDNKSLVMAVFSGLVVLLVMLVFLYVKVRVGSRRSA